MLKKTLIASVVFFSFAGFGAAFAYAIAAPVDLAAGPVFPAASTQTPKASTAAPTGAQYRVRSGKTGVRYVACNESRLVNGKHEERRCLSHSPSKGWGKSMRWHPSYTLYPLTGELPRD